MSFFTVACPWCGAVYTTGMVGRRLVGSGHVCEARKPCWHRDCEALGTFAVGRLDRTPGIARFSCANHIEDRRVVQCQVIALDDTQAGGKQEP